MNGYLKWTLAAVVGLVLAAGLAFASYELVSEPIGLSTEPVTAGEELAPEREREPDKRRSDDSRESPAPTPKDSKPAAPVQTNDSLDDKGGDRKDRREGDDDSSGHGKGGDDSGGDDSDDD